MSDIPTPTPMVPHICMSCGDSKSTPATEYGAPYCLNHGSAIGAPLMTPLPLDFLRKMISIQEEYEELKFRMDGLEK